MAKSIMANGKTICTMAKANGLLLLRKTTSKVFSLIMLKKQALVKKFNQMVNPTKVTTLTARGKATVNIIGLSATSTQETIMKVLRKAMVSCLKKMVTYTKETLIISAYSMAKALISTKMARFTVVNGIATTCRVSIMKNCSSKIE